MKDVVNDYGVGIDLGLPSGNKWALCNVGANNPYESGQYFFAREICCKRLVENWYIPSANDFNELLNNCSYSWIYDYENSGMDGCLFQSKVNDKSIFIPAAGCVDNGYIDEINYRGYYWAWPVGGMSSDAYYLSLKPAFPDVGCVSEISFGFCIRPIYK